MVTDKAELQEPILGGGGSGPEPPEQGYGGGDGGGESFPNFGDRLRRARLGLAIAIVPIVTVFVAFTTIYILRKNFALNNNDGNLITPPVWVPIELPGRILLINTAILLASSMSVELARRQTKRRAALAMVASIPGVSLGREVYFPWLGTTIVLGLSFLAGQWMAWRELAERGFYLATSPSSSIFYILTATHGLHLLGGLIVLLYAGIVAVRPRTIESRRIILEICALYWHFMLALWIYIFALMWFAR